jgi:hypothetical protein
MLKVKELTGLNVFLFKIFPDIRSKSAETNVYLNPNKSKAAKHAANQVSMLSAQTGFVMWEAIFQALNKFKLKKN